MTFTFTLKQLVVAGLAVSLGLAASFAAGRYSKPVQTVTVHEVTTKTITVHEKGETIIKYVNVKADEHTTKTSTTTTKPDGTKTTTTTSTTDKHAESDSKTSDKTIEKTTTDKTSIEKDKTVITNSRPAWRLAAKAGFDIHDLNLHSLPSVVYGASLERRVLGPVWLGGWGLSNGNVGVSVGLEF